MKSTQETSKKIPEGEAAAELFYPTACSRTARRELHPPKTPHHWTRLALQQEYPFESVPPSTDVK